jgi:transposase
MVGCDLHEGSLVLRIDDMTSKPVFRNWANKRRDRKKMIADLRRRARAVEADRVVLAYEACGFGFVVCDELIEAGIECHVLAPIHIPRSPKRRKVKTDQRDAKALLELVRGYVLAGNALPSIWVPDAQTRDDRELLRRRLDAGDRLGTTKTQIRWFLYRNGLEKPAEVGEAWSVAYRHWLCDLVDHQLSPGAAAALGSLLRQHDYLLEEKALLQRQVEALARSERHRAYVAALCRHKGVGELTAMTFLVELGRPDRFANRREVGAFLGLTPASSESGQDDDHKGHITRQGPGRVRKILCQAVWSRIGSDPEEAIAYQRLVAKNPKRKKIALVARMRHLAVVLWHEALDAHRRTAA